MSINKKVINLINRFKRRQYIKQYKNKLINRNFTIISSNCNGGFIMNDLGVKFNTPTVNLFLKPKDFNKFLLNFDKYINMDLEEEKVEDLKYPIGKLGDIKIYFQHYKSFEEAKVKWDERKKRVNLDNMFIMSTDRDGCTKEDIIQFDKLPYKNKVIFTHKIYPDIKSTFYIKGFENAGEVGVLSEFRGLTGMRYYDEFDYVKWFNGE